MDYLEKFILNTWKNIPSAFKKRINNIELITVQENDAYPTRLTELTKGDDGYYKIVIYTRPLQSKFQKEINKLIINELARVFGFDEEEAYELMSKKI